MAMACAFLLLASGTNRMAQSTRNAPPPPRRPRRDGLPPFRTVRPSLLDLRFTGDPWIVAGDDGAAALCLDDYRLATLSALRLDLPSLNRTLCGLRRPVCRR
jgi:hypothetical protein